MRFRKILTLIGIFAISFGCINLDDLQDAEVPSYDASFAVPLVNSTISLKEILEEYEDVDALRVDEEGLLHFMYRGEVLGREAMDVFSQFSEVFPPFFPILGKDLSLPLSELNGANINRLDLNQGAFTYYLENNNAEPISVTFNFPSLIKDGTPLSFSVDVPGYDGNGPRPFVSNQPNPIDLNGYAIVPTGNEISINYTAQTTSGQDVFATNFVVRLDNLAFTYAEGYLGPLLFEGGKDTISIDFFNTYIDGSIFFAEPEVSFLVENAFGVPTRSVVNSFLVETVNDEQLSVESPLVETGVDFPYPGLNEIGTSKTATYLFDKSNSNVDRLLGAGPTRVTYDIDALLNPDEDDSIIGFVTDSSFYKVQMLVDLPLFGTASGFTANDTIGFDLGNTSDDLESAELKVVTENELGIDIFVQGYFLDAQGQVLDLLFAESQQIVKGATADENGIPGAAVQLITFIDLDRDRLDKIEDAESIRLEVGFSTESNGETPVKTLESHNVNIRIGAILNVKTD